MPDPLTPEARQRALEWWQGCLSYLHVHDVSLPEGVIATINAALLAPALTPYDLALASTFLNQYANLYAPRDVREDVRRIAAKIRAARRPEAQP